MRKVRLTYVAGDKEKDRLIELLKREYEVVHVSKEYRGRGTSQYNNVYVDLVEKSR